MAQLPNEPVYLIPKTSPVIEKYQNLFEMFENDEKLHTLTVDINPDVVQGMDHGMLQEIIAALQHYPHLIERFILILEFKFAQIADSELYFQEEEWKSDSKYQRWFHKMGEGPISLFFIHDDEARFFTIAGDFIADGKCTVRRDEGKAPMIGFEGDELEQIFNRVYTSCWLFHIYCHGSGFDPQPAIEAIIEEFQVPFSYEEVRTKYEEDIKQGIHLRIVKKTDEGEIIM